MCCTYIFSPCLRGPNGLCFEVLLSKIQLERLLAFLGCETNVWRTAAAVHPSFYPWRLFCVKLSLAVEGQQCKTIFVFLLHQFRKGLYFLNPSKKWSLKPENFQGSCSYFPGKCVMPVLNLPLCFDTNICTFGYHHGTALPKADHLFGLEGGQEWQKIRAEVAPLYCVGLCWFKELVKLWSGVPSSQGVFSKMQGFICWWRHSSL